MSKNLMATVAMSALAVGGLGFAPVAAAAPSGPASVTETVMGLRDQGYTVIVNSVGMASLDQCTMYAVRPGHTYSRMDSGFAGAGDDTVTRVVSMTVYVDTSC